jgi:hypothetical protein
MAYKPMKGFFKKVGDDPIFYDTESTGLETDGPDRAGIRQISFTDNKGWFIDEQLNPEVSLEKYTDWYNKLGEKESSKGVQSTTWRPEEYLEAVSGLPKFHEVFPAILDKIEQRAPTSRNFFSGYKPNDNFDKELIGGQINATLERFKQAGSSLDVAMWEKIQTRWNNVETVNQNIASQLRSAFNSKMVEMYPSKKIPLASITRGTLSQVHGAATGGDLIGAHGALADAQAVAVTYYAAKNQQEAVRIEPVNNNHITPQQSAPIPGPATDAAASATPAKNPDWLDPLRRKLGGKEYRVDHYGENVAITKLSRPDDQLILPLHVSPFQASGFSGTDESASYYLDPKRETTARGAERPVTVIHAYLRNEIDNAGEKTNQLAMTSQLISPVTSLAEWITTAYEKSETNEKTVKQAFGDILFSQEEDSPKISMTQVKDKNLTMMKKASSQVGVEYYLTSKEKPSGEVKNIMVRRVQEGIERLSGIFSRLRGMVVEREDKLTYAANAGREVLSVGQLSKTGSVFKRGQEAKAESDRAYPIKDGVKVDAVSPTGKDDSRWRWTKSRVDLAGEGGDAREGYSTNVAIVRTPFSSGSANVYQDEAVQGRLSNSRSYMGSIAERSLSLDTTVEDILNGEVKITPVSHKGKKPVEIGRDGTSIATIEYAQNKERKDRVIAQRSEGAERQEVVSGSSYLEVPLYRESDKITTGDEIKRLEAASGYKVRTSENAHSISIKYLESQKYDVSLKSMAMKAGMAVKAMKQVFSTGVGDIPVDILTSEVKQQTLGTDWLSNRNASQVKDILSGWKRQEGISKEEFDARAAASDVYRLAQAKSKESGSEIRIPISEMTTAYNASIFGSTKGKGIGEHELTDQMLQAILPGENATDAERQQSWNKFGATVVRKGQWVQESVYSRDSIASTFENAIGARRMDKNTDESGDAEFINSTFRLSDKDGNVIDNLYEKYAQGGKEALPSHAMMSVLAKDDITVMSILSSFRKESQGGGGLSPNEHDQIKDLFPKLYKELGYGDGDDSPVKRAQIGMLKAANLQMGGTLENESERNFVSNDTLGEIRSISMDPSLNEVDRMKRVTDVLGDDINKPLYFENTGTYGIHPALAETLGHKKIGEAIESNTSEGNRAITSLAQIANIDSDDVNARTKGIQSYGRQFQDFISDLGGKGNTGKALAGYVQKFQNTFSRSAIDPSLNAGEVGFSNSMLRNIASSITGDGGRKLAETVENMPLLRGLVRRFPMTAQPVAIQQQDLSTLPPEWQKVVRQQGESAESTGIRVSGQLAQHFRGDSDNDPFGFIWAARKSENGIESIPDAKLAKNIFSPDPRSTIQQFFGDKFALIDANLKAQREYQEGGPDPLEKARSKRKEDEVEIIKAQTGITLDSKQGMGLVYGENNSGTPWMRAFGFSADQSERYSQRVQGTYQFYLDRMAQGRNAKTTDIARAVAGAYFGTNSKSGGSSITIPSIANGDEIYTFADEKDKTRRITAAKSEAKKVEIDTESLFKYEGRENYAELAGVMAARTATPITVEKDKFSMPLEYLAASIAPKGKEKEILKLLKKNKKSIYEDGQLVPDKVGNLITKWTLKNLGADGEDYTQRAVDLLSPGVGAAMTNAMAKAVDNVDNETGEVRISGEDKSIANIAEQTRGTDFMNKMGVAVAARTLYRKFSGTASPLVESLIQSASSWIGSTGMKFQSISVAGSSFGADGSSTPEGVFDRIFPSTPAPTATATASVPIRNDAPVVQTSPAITNSIPLAAPAKQAAPVQALAATDEERAEFTAMQEDGDDGAYDWMERFSALKAKVFPPTSSVSDGTSGPSGYPKVDPMPADTDPSGDKPIGKDFISPNAARKYLSDFGNTARNETSVIQNGAVGLLKTLGEMGHPDVLLKEAPEIIRNMNDEDKSRVLSKHRVELESAMDLEGKASTAQFARKFANPSESAVQPHLYALRKYSATGLEATTKTMQDIAYLLQPEDKKPQLALAHEARLMSGDSDGKIASLNTRLETLGVTGPNAEVGSRIPKFEQLTEEERSTLGRVRDIAGTIPEGMLPIYTSPEVRNVLSAANTAYEMKDVLPSKFLNPDQPKELPKTDASSLKHLLKISSDTRTQSLYASATTEGLFDDVGSDQWKDKVKQFLTGNESARARIVENAKAGTGLPSDVREANRGEAGAALAGLHTAIGNSSLGDLLKPPPPPEEPKVFLPSPSEFRFSELDNRVADSKDTDFAAAYNDLRGEAVRSGNALDVNRGASSLGLSFNKLEKSDNLTSRKALARNASQIEAAVDIEASRKKALKAYSDAGYNADDIANLPANLKPDHNIVSLADLGAGRGYGEQNTVAAQHLASFTGSAEYTRLDTEMRRRGLVGGTQNFISDPQAYANNMNAMLADPEMKKAANQLLALTKEGASGKDGLSSQLTPDQAQVQKALDYSKGMPGMKESFSNKEASAPAADLAKSLSHLNAVMADTTDLTDKLVGAKKKEREEITSLIDINKKDAEINANRLHDKADSLHALIGVAKGAGEDTSELEDEYSQTLKLAGKFEDLSNGKLDSEDKGGMKSMRQLIGGFGMMYVKSLFGIATQGLGQGIQERTAYEEKLWGASNRLFGVGDAPYNEAAQLANIASLYGTSNNPVNTLQLLGKKNQMLGEIANVGGAALGAYSLAQFVGLPALGPAAAIAIGGVALSADLYSRTQDQNGMAYRLSTSKGDEWDFGEIPDQLALNAQNIFGGEEGKKEAKRTVQLANQQLMMNESLAAGMSIAEIRARMYVGHVGSDKLEDTLYGDVDPHDQLRQTADYLKGMNPNLSDEGALQASQLINKNWLTMFSAPTQQNLVNSFAAGNPIVDQAIATLSGFGKSPYVKGGDYSYASDSLTVDIAARKFDDMQGKQYSAGLKVAQGADWTRFYAQTNEEMIDNTMAMGLNPNAPSTQLWEAQGRALTAQQASGMNVADPSLAPQPAYDMTPAEFTRAMSIAGAGEGRGNQTISIASSALSKAYFYGFDSLGESQYDTITSAKSGQEKMFLSRLYSGDPMAMTASAQRGAYSGVAALPTLEGRMINSRFLGMVGNTDIGMNGQMTGMQWGSTSLASNTFAGGPRTAQQNAADIWGSNYATNPNLSQQLINTAINGYDLGATIKAGGQYISKVGGTIGISYQMRDNEFNYSMANFARQEQQVALDSSYTRQSWKFQDKGRDLSNAFQAWQFQFQQQQLDISKSNFAENMGLQKQQTMMQRSYAREDVAYNATVRNLQWGWKQADFAEESRFMTGRQRKIAERQNDRDVTMHNLEGDQIDKQTARQEQLWKLEDKRFEIQRKQFNESMKMQQISLDKNKEYFEARKDLENQEIKLQRAHYKQQVALQKEAAAAAKAYAIEQHKQKVSMDLATLAAQLNGAAMNTLADGWENSVFGATTLNVQLGIFATKMQQLAGTFSEMLDGSSSGTGTGDNGSGGGVDPVALVAGALRGNDAASFSKNYASRINSMASETTFIPTANKSAASQQQVINVYVGNEKLGDFVVKRVQQELSG